MESFDSIGSCFLLDHFLNRKGEILISPNKLFECGSIPGNLFILEDKLKEIAKELASLFCKKKGRKELKRGNS